MAPHHKFSSASIASSLRPSLLLRLRRRQPLYLLLLVVFIGITFTSAAAAALPVEHCEQVMPITDRLVLQYAYRYDADDPGFVVRGLQIQTTSGNCVLHQIAVSSSGTPTLRRLDR
jgi:hypothetical protein